MVTLSAQERLERKVAALLVPPANLSLEYHAIALTGEPGGGMTIAHMCTRWVGWHDLARRVELRESAPVDARYARAFEALGLPCHYVLTDLQLMLFMRAGGAALVERELAEAFFPALTEAIPAYTLGRSGFVEERVLSKGARSRRPSPKRRRAILERDGGRCRVCERDPADFVDMELEVHHIRPWAMGGTSDPTNLITLCRRCHKSLKPHFNRALFERVEQRDAVSYFAEFSQGVSDYRETNPIVALGPFRTTAGK